MKWLASFGIALLTAPLGGVAGYYVAERCIDWFSISSFEGGSGYFAVFLTLLGIVVGFVLGLVVSRGFAGSDPTFLVALGRSAAAVAGITATVLGIARLNAHVPPQLDGSGVQLELEVRMPAGWQPDGKARADENQLYLTALAPGKRMASSPGALPWSESTFENGRWTLRPSVSVFTTRGERLVDMHVGKEYVGIVVPLPPRPSAKYLAWSEWRTAGITQPVDGPPLTGYEYRFRIRKSSELAAIARTEEAERLATEERAYAALTDDSPLETWVRHANFDAPEDRKARAYATLGRRFADFPRLAESTDAELLTVAGYALDNLQPMPADGRAAMLALGRALPGRVARYLAENPEGEEDLKQAVGLQRLVQAWVRRWALEWPEAVAEIRPELQALLREASRRESAEPMREIVYTAKHALEQLDQPAAPADGGAGPSADS